MKKLKKYKWGIIISLAVILSIIFTVTLVNISRAEMTNTNETATKADNEKKIVKMAANLAMGKDANGKLTETSLLAELNTVRGSGRTTVEEISGENKILVTFLETGRQYEVYINTGGIVGDNEPTYEYVSPSEIFDIAGTDTNKLHIGDFIEYDAGTWTQEEINAIQTGEIGNLQTANGSTSLPKGDFQFGGFTAGSSRNGNATPDTSYGNNNYVKDASTGEAITGWRLFDIEEDGTVVLISAGNPEDYYQPRNTNGACISEYILSGNINSVWSNGATEASNYQKRNWDIYASGTKGESATVLNKNMLDAWYSKYIQAGTDTWNTEILQKIYEEPYIRYQNVIDNYSDFALVNSTTLPDMMYYFITLGRYVSR